MTTTIRVRAIPVGAAIHLTRRALALGPDRFTHRRVLELLAEWWTMPQAGPDALLPVNPPDPFTWALSILEST